MQPFLLLGVFGLVSERFFCGGAADDMVKPSPHLSPMPVDPRNACGVCIDIATRTVARTASCMEWGLSVSSSIRDDVRLPASLLAAAHRLTRTWGYLGWGCNSAIHGGAGVARQDETR